jgi:hypothetical protein
MNQLSETESWSLVARWLPGGRRGLPAPILGSPVFRDGISGPAVPFFVTAQVFDRRGQKEFWSVGRRMSQRLQQIPGDQNGNFMGGETKLGGRLGRRQPVGKMPQIQKPFDVLVHMSSLNVHFFAIELMNQIIHKHSQPD